MLTCAIATCDAGTCVSTAIDTDQDRTPDCTDNCPIAPNEDQADFDGDGMGDACESGVQAADIDLSGRVNGFDLVHLAVAFSTSCGEPSYDASTDLDRSCFVDGEDLAVLAANFAMTVLP